MRNGTAACRIRWKKNSAVAEEPSEHCTDNELDALIVRADVIGIDAPFGWPQPFVAAVAAWTADSWTPKTRDWLQFRETDRMVREKVQRWPLSVSSDRIALPAMRAMAILRRHGVTDRSGDGEFFEVYPAASLSCWGLPSRGYKRDDEKCFELRKKILSELRTKLPWLDVPESYAESADSLDALIASLTARVAKQGLTAKPNSDQMGMAAREGWIHLPIALPKP